jgi:glycosyltransferase involved in cell wall biosynthesis
MNTPCETSDLLVFSHLRWDFIFERPQHVLSRHASHRRVFYFEEPVFGMTDSPRLHLKLSQENVQVVVPHLPSGMEPSMMDSALTELLNELVYEEDLRDFTVMYYSPAALSFSRHLTASVVIFDCMDHAYENGMDSEHELISRSDVVFTSNQSLYESKKNNHHNVHPFPNSIDLNHFSHARMTVSEPLDQARIPHPRIGFYGGMEKIFNFDLLTQMADLRPEFQFVMLGPIDRNPSDLPLRANIYYLGKKNYEEIPLYMAGWDAGIIPFSVKNPKTAEYLAAGKPVVSIALNDVVHPYGDAKLVYIASNPHTFVECLEKAINESQYDPEWIERVDNFLDGNSWDVTFLEMASHEIKIRDDRREMKTEIKIPAYMDSSLRAIGIV